jgi:hypothetical protein
MSMILPDLRRKRVTRASALACLGLLLCAPAAQAKRIVIDFAATSDGTGMSNVGQSFVTTIDPTTDCAAASTVAASCVLQLSPDKTSGAIPLGFSIQIGSNSYSAVYVTENGLVNFIGTLPDGYVGAADFSALQTALGNIGASQRFIAPFYADLQTPTDTTDPGGVYGQGGILYARGSADPNQDTPLAANRVPAFYVAWVDPTDVDAGFNFFGTQLLIYSRPARGAGDFDIRIRYGTVDGVQFNPGTGQNLGGTAGFSLGTGSDAQALANPLLADSDYFYSFHNGHLLGAVVDTDGDGVADSADNCPTRANADQADSNHNGVGDVCEPPPPPQRCDVDHDRDVDLYDINAILRALGRKASSSSDPRDADGNMRITLLDALKCTAKCTRRRCAPR